MVGNVLVWLLVVGITALLGWIAARAWRASRPIVKWSGAVLAGLLALVGILLSAASLIGLVKLYASRDAPIPALTVAGTPEQVARGKYLALSSCVACHSTNNELPLTGGVDLGKELSIPVGSFVSGNLTPGGPLEHWSDGEIFRALRHGVDREGRWLIFMSNVRVRHMSDEDIMSLIAYLRSQRAVDIQIQDPLDQPSFAAAIMLGLGLFPEGQAPVEGVVTAPPKGPTVEYGEYILSHQDCRDCHGEDLTGGREGQLAPIGPSLRVVRGWTEEQLITTLRTGIDPSGHTLSEQMPWRALSRLDDEDLAALYAYLVSLP